MSPRARAVLLLLIGAIGLLVVGGLVRILVAGQAASPPPNSADTVTFAVVLVLLAIGAFAALLESADVFLEGRSA